MRHTDGNLWQARAALAQEAIRGQPGRGGALLHILPQANIDGIVVLGYVAVDVVQAAVADLHVDLAAEQHTQEVHEGRYHFGARATLEPCQAPHGYHPGRDMPVRRTAALVLRLEAPLEYHEEPVAMASCKKEPDTPHQEIHVQCHDVRAGKDAVLIPLQKIGPRKFPLRWCNGNEYIRESTEPYLTSQITTVLIQEGMSLLVEAADQHDTHQVCQRVSNDLPIPACGLGVTGHNITRDPEGLGTHLVRERERKREGEKEREREREKKRERKKEREREK